MWNFPSFSPVVSKQVSYINSTSSSRASWLWYFLMITCTIDVILSEIAKILSTLDRKKERGGSWPFRWPWCTWHVTASRSIKIGEGGVTREQAPQKVKKVNGANKARKIKSSNEPSRVGIVPRLVHLYLSPLPVIRLIVFLLRFPLPSTVSTVMVWLDARWRTRNELSCKRCFRLEAIGSKAGERVSFAFAL